jgi:hypothetical protein
MVDKVGTFGIPTVAHQAMLHALKDIKRCFVYDQKILNTL